MTTKVQISANPYNLWPIPPHNDELFMQNKPNLLTAQTNVTSFTARDYENIHLLEQGKNKANTNPIKANQTQFRAIFDHFFLTYITQSNWFYLQRGSSNSAEAGSEVFSFERMGQFF